MIDVVQLEALLQRVADRAVDRALAALTARPGEPTPFLTAAQLAKRIGVSVAHVRRLDPPHVIVGDAKTKRYDLDAVRAWLTEREPAPTTPKKTEPDVDVSGITAAAGLRASHPFGGAAMLAGAPLSPKGGAR